MSLLGLAVFDDMSATMAEDLFDTSYLMEFPDEAEIDRWLSMELDVANVSVRSTSY